MSAVAPVGAQSLAPAAAPSTAAAPSSAVGATPTAAGTTGSGEISSTDLMKAFLIALLLNALGDDQQKNDSGAMLGLLLLASMSQSSDCGFASVGANGAQQAYGANAAATQPSGAAGIDATA